MRTYQFQMAGVEHLALGRAYEDRLAWALVGDCGLALAMADGMTSCLFASEAAEIATGEALRVMLAASPVSAGTYGDALALSAAPVAALSAARNALIGRAAEMGSAVTEFGTTLMVAQYLEAVPNTSGDPVGTGELRYAYSGDGGIIALGSGRETRLVVEPQELGEGRTHALTESDWWRTGSESGVMAFLVATDGLLDALLDRGEPNELARTILLMGPGHDAELDALLGCVAGGGASAPPTADVGDDRTLFVCWSNWCSDGARGSGPTGVVREAPAVERCVGFVPTVSFASKGWTDEARGGRGRWQNVEQEGAKQRGADKRGTGKRGTKRKGLDKRGAGGAHGRAERRGLR